MSDGDVTLSLAGRGSLTFRDATHKWRTVAGGETFTTDPDTAALLLKDDSVTVAGTAPAGLTVIDGGGASDLSGMTVKELRALAAERGVAVASRATKAVLVAALEATPGPASGGDTTGGEALEPGEDPDATASGESGTPPVDDEQDPTLGHRSDLTDRSGAVTVSDLPDGARVGPDRI